MKKYLFYFIYVFVALGFCGWGIKLNHEIAKLQNHHISDGEYSYALDCIREAELSYWEVKADLVHEVQNYINTVAPTSNLRGYAIVEECEKYNVDICFVLAQGEVESHFGTRGLGGKANNVFNVRIDDDKKSIEDVDKEYVYDYPNESIEPYLKLLTKKYLVGKLEGDLMTKYVDINGKRYASNPNYENLISYRYKYICDNTKIQEKYDIMKSYAIKCNR